MNTLTQTPTAPLPQRKPGESLQPVSVHEMSMNKLNDPQFDERLQRGMGSVIREVVDTHGLTDQHEPALQSLVDRQKPLIEANKARIANEERMRTQVPNSRPSADRDLIRAA